MGLVDQLDQPEKLVDKEHPESEDHLVWNNSIIFQSISLFLTLILFLLIITLIIPQIYNFNFQVNADLQALQAQLVE